YVPAQLPAKKKKPAAKQQKKIGFGDETMLAPDFASLVREARMKMGLTHEQLGMKMNEKAQPLKKIESGALKPDELLAKKLERHLGIKLYVSANSDDE
ncbi:MAG TPA: helix-turn-helix domain-containing protein, partial [Nitrososphaera sp.]|nr:helix-turn-helix domain-containing protein [Nitrososphaera sp.]